MDNLPYTFCEQIGKEIRDISDEIPFEIPESWEWCRLGICLDVRDGTHDTPKYVPQGIPLVTSKNLRNGHVDFSTAKLISVQDHEAISQRSKVDNGDIMFAMIGSIGNPVLYYGDENFSIKNMALFKKIQSGMDMSYVYWFLLLAQDNMKKYASGGVQSFVSLSYLRNYYIPVPPISEQKRIVAKIEELLPFIEKYEQAETKLTALNKSFPEMLKKSILQEAVQGKLVPQNPDDEPASILLERIRAEKQELIRQGKIKKSKHESIIVTRDKIPYEIIDGKERCIADEVPFEIPESWEWARIFSIGAIIRGSGIKRTETINKGKPCIRYGELYTTYNIQFSNTVSFVSDNLFEKCKKITTGDLLFTLTGENKPDIAKTITYIGEKEVAIGGDLAYWTCHGMNSLYLTYFMCSPYAVNCKIKLATGDISVHISGEKIGSILMPVPPLPEQKRIVEKIEELMTFCEKLK